MKYILVEWPDVQYLMGKEGFKENSSLADEEKFGSSAYFVSEEWYDENYEEEEYDFNVRTVIEIPVEISITINASDYQRALIKLDSLSQKELVIKSYNIGYDIYNISETSRKELEILDY